MESVKFCGMFYASTRTPGSNIVSTTGFSPLLEVWPFTLDVPVNNQKERSFQCGSVGLVLAQNSYVEDTIATMVVNQEGLKTVQASSRSTVTELTGTAGSETLYSVTLSSTPGEFVDIGTYSRVSDVVIAGSVAGTDYIVEEDLGMIATILGGNLVAGGATDLAFDYAAETGGLAEVGRLTTVEWALKAKIRNLYKPSDPVRLININAAAVDPTAETQIIGTSPDDPGAKFEYTLGLRALPDPAVSGSYLAPMTISGVPFSDF